MITRLKTWCGSGILTALLLTGCIKEEDDYISKYCPGSCTEVSGRVLQAGNQQPLQGVQVLAIWDNRRHFKEGLGGTVRKKAVTYTDVTGSYTLRFLLRDDEMQDGEIAITPQVRNCDQSDCQTYTLYWDELRRDTTYTHDFLIR
ncbi:carboxypeptidase regulatory-like domain-containing protein [Pontibacter amylolyticus]|uniref:Lipoprotein n=1 Tax=Pontibacter amylolyticus TaxID=1424080 RepID=A0ABQ1W9B1_9BACT|nr:carboxypeptidase regulatory-like domain-containing protein [Pontibacter amylolyticus]GGG20692.1 hypothetical protein GCM10011323_25880 [Pontibacter amylolyticus]